ncbi:MAG: hypothetical protein Q8941_01380 [Bacteroidota bacterium]|nr:hypothetical protein [Bacteroidota bacterium]
MSFNNAGPVTSIAPGATLRWSYSWGSDHGFQHAGADIKTPGAELVAFEQGKKMENNGSINYFVNIKNVGTVTCLHNLQGGGAS